MPSVLWWETKRVRVIGGVYAADRIGEAHVDFEEEVREESEGDVGEVGFVAQEGDAGGVYGEVEEEPDTLV